MHHLTTHPNPLPAHVTHPQVFKVASSVKDVAYQNAVEEVQKNDRRKKVALLRQKKQKGPKGGLNPRGSGEDKGELGQGEERSRRGNEGERSRDHGCRAPSQGKSGKTIGS